MKECGFIVFLAVEDDLALRNQLKWSRHRREAVTNADREPAPIRFRRHPTALVMMDLGLPESERIGYACGDIAGATDITPQQGIGCPLAPADCWQDRSTAYARQAKLLRYLPWRADELLNISRPIPYDLLRRLSIR
jgi:hypothetical protein